MIRRDMLRWVAAAGLVGATAGCGSTPLLRRNYEFEIRYLANERPLTARVVQQLQYRAHTAGMPGGRIDLRSARGEGAVVRVPKDGSVIVATLAELRQAAEGQGPFGSRGIDGVWDPLTALTREMFPTRPLETETFKAVMAFEPPSRWMLLAPDDMPLIVRFVDASDPGSAEWVNQWSEEGPIKVVSARLRITSGEITRGELEHALPWIDEVEEENPFQMGRVGERSPVSALLTAGDLRNVR